MRKNLAAFLTLLLFSSLLSRRCQGHQWEASWREELLFSSSEPYPHRALQVDEDRYQYFECDSGPWRRIDEGVVLLGSQGEIGFFSTSRGCKMASFNGRELLGEWGRLSLEDQIVPRLKPDSTWLTPGGAFSVGRIQVGMPHWQVRELYPTEATAAHDATQFFYGDFRQGMLEVRYDANDRVARVGGKQLEQGGRPLFNGRSRRKDVERTFPGAHWRVSRPQQIQMPISGGTVTLTMGDLGEARPDFQVVLDHGTAPRQIGQAR